MMAFSRLSLIAAACITCILGSNAAASSTDSGITRDDYCGKTYCITATYSPIEEQINYTLSVIGSGPSSGWYAIGQGNKMAGSNMMIGWVNSDSSITTSQRSTSGHRQPLASQVTASTYSVDTVNTKLINNTIVNLSWTFSQSTTPSNAMAHMWAYSTKAPSSSQSDATIAMHNSYDQFNLDMTKAYINNSTSSTTSSTKSSTTPSSGKASSSTPLLPSNNTSSSNKSANIFLAHMIFMVIAWMLLAPFGALLARYGRTLFTWFPAHRLIQMTALLFTIIGFILGVVGVSSEESQQFTETHHRVGLIMLILILVQIALGYWAHDYRAKTGKRHVGLFHIPLGIILFGLGIWNTQSGFQLWSVQPNFNISYLVYGWAAFMILLYIGGLFLLPREIKQARHLQSASESQEAFNLEKMQTRQVDSQMPVNDYITYQQINSSEMGINRSKNMYNV